MFKTGNWKTRKFEVERLKLRLRLKSVWKIIRFVSEECILL